MPVDRNVTVWIPGSLKLQPSDPLPQTSIVFPESVIHPRSQNPNVTAQTQEEDILNFSYAVLSAMNRHYATLPIADRPLGFDIRQNFLSNQLGEGLSVSFRIDIPLDSALLFGRKEIA